MAIDAQVLTDSIYTKQLDLQGRVQTAMDRMSSIASLPFMSWFDFASTPAFEPQRAGTITLANLPSLQKAILNVDLNAGSIDRYKSHIWTGGDLDALQVKLMQYINTGGVGIEQATQDAIFGQGRERDLQTLRDGMDMSGARTGAKGFRYPTSMTKALMKEALVTWQNAKTDLNREIVKIMADLAQKNVQFAIQHDISIEQLHSDFALKYAALYLDNTRHIIEKFKAEQDSYIAEFDGKLRGIMANLEVQKVNGNLELAFQGALQKKWELEANISVEKGKAQIQQSEQANTSKIEAGKSMVVATTGMMQSMASNAVSVVSSTKKG